MSSLDIDIILLNDGYVKVIINQDTNEIWEETYEKEDKIEKLIESYESKTKNKFPKDMLNKIKSSKEKNVTNNEDQLINYITGYEEKNFALEQNDDTFIPDIIGKPFDNPFSVFTYIKKEKSFKLLKFKGNNDLQELENYGPSSAYCNGNNLLFISGGEKANGDYVNKFWKIDLNNAEIETTDMATKKNHSMIAIPGNYVFIVGGQNKETFYYDLNENQFCGWKKLNKDRIEPALILVNNYLYCFDNMNSNSNEKFTFEKTDIYSEEHTWEICEPNISSIKMNQKYFGVSEYNNDIIFIGGNLDLEEEEDNYGLNERKNYKYNINENCIEESDVPYIDYNFKEKTFLKYNDRISYILPDFNRHHPEVMFYQKEKSVIKFLKGYSKKKLEQKEREEKNNRDFSTIKIGFQFNLNQPKENENVENLELVNNLNNEFNKDEKEEIKNPEENENQNQDLNDDLGQKSNNDVQEINENASQKPQENFEMNIGENQELNELNAQINLRGQNVIVDVNPNLKVDLEGKEIQKSGIKEHDMNINISQPNLGVNVDKNLQINTGLNIQNPVGNLNINREIDMKGLNPNVNVNLNNLAQPGFNINGPNINIPQTNIDLKQPEINANINVPNPQINGGLGVSIPVPSSNLQAQMPFNLSGIIVGTGDNPSKYQKMRAQNPSLEIIVPNSNMNLNFPNANINPNINLQGPNINAGIQQPNFNLQGPNINAGIQQPNLNLPNVNVNTNIQQPNLNLPSVDVNAGIQQPNLNLQGPNINAGIQQPNISLQGPNINAGIQQPNLSLQGTNINAIPSQNINVNAQVPNINAGAYNQKGEFSISGVIVGFSETNPGILKYRNNPMGLNTNINAQVPNPNINLNNNMNVGLPSTNLNLNANTSNLNAQMPNVNIKGPNVNVSGLGTNINNNFTNLGDIGVGNSNLNLNINPTHSGVNINGPQINMNANNIGASLNMPKVDIKGTNQNLGGEININNNLNTGMKSQLINVPNIEITNPIVGGNLAGNLNTNVQNNFNPNQELKPVDLKMEGNINIQNPQNCYDAQGNFNYTGIIPSKNDNNLSASINNVNMSNLLLLQSNRIDTNLKNSKIGINNNINQSAIVNTQLNTDVKNDNKIGVNVNLGGIGLNTNK